ncbi:MAG: SCO family protein [Gemmatimonadota bacterium]
MHRFPLAAFAAAVTALAACAPSADLPPDPHNLPLRGTKPFAPLEKVDFTLTDTQGRPFDFRAETDGKIALLFFGYTFCPDICPLHMATLAAALDEVATDVRDQVVLVSRGLAGGVRQLLRGGTRQPGRGLGGPLVLPVSPAGDQWRGGRLYGRPSSPHLCLRA